MDSSKADVFQLGIAAHTADFKVDLLRLLDSQRDILDIAIQANNVGVFDNLLNQIQSTCRLLDLAHNQSVKVL